MKLVDMLGLKPRPLRGPGSTPGTGSILIIYHFMQISPHFNFRLSPNPLYSLLSSLQLENIFPLLVNHTLFFHLLFSYLLLLLLVTLVCLSTHYLLRL